LYYRSHGWVYKSGARHLTSQFMPLDSLGNQMNSTLEQRRVVAELDALQAEAGALKRVPAKTCQGLEALLPAVLDRAFRREL